MDADWPVPDREIASVDVSIVMPCLNEVQCLPTSRRRRRRL